MSNPVDLKTSQASASAEFRLPGSYPFKASQMSVMAFDQVHSSDLQESTGADRTSDAPQPSGSQRGAMHSHSNPSIRLTGKKLLP
eukprot:5952268-Amphidinium_carterae.1